MKTIGLLGGMSWESTVTYYRLINEGIRKRLGGLHSAKIFLYSVDFHEIELLQSSGKWDAAGEILGRAARRIEGAGADFLVLCTNTMHRVAPLIEKSIRIPLLHIADATAEKIAAAGIENVGLLGTRFTMEEEFYRGRLESGYGLRVLVPDEADRELVHKVIYQELCLGNIQEASRSEYLRIIQRLSEQGAQGVILGCTEIALLIQQNHTPVPLYDTTQIHAERAVEEALREEKEVRKKPPGAGKSSFDLIDPQRLFSLLGLKKDTVFLDLGCGIGNYALEAVRHMGEEGIVYALDPWREGIESLQRTVSDRGISNLLAGVIHVGRRLPLSDKSVDMCFIATAFHDMVQEGTHEIALLEVKRLLKTDGRLAVVEFKKVEGPPGPPIHIRISPEDLETMLSAYGFRKILSEEIGQWNYLAVFQPCRLG